MASTWPAPAYGLRRTSITTERSGSMARSTAVLALSLVSTPRSASRLATVLRQGRAMSLLSWCSTAPWPNHVGAFLCAMQLWRLSPPTKSDNGDWYTGALQHRAEPCSTMSCVGPGRRGYDPRED